MKQQLAIVFLVAVISSTFASPHLVRRQAEPAEDAAPPPADAPGAVPPAPAAPAPAAGAAPPAPAAGAAPPAPAAAAPAAARPAPTGRVAPPAAAAPAGPSVFTLPDGAGLVIGQINSGFTCEGKIYGYYADTNNDCRIFHVCVPVLDEQGQATQPALIFSFFCNNGTKFNQEALVCDFEANVDCSLAEGYYSVNQEFGKIPEGSQGRAAAAPAPAAPAPAARPAAAPAARPAAPAASAPAASAPAPAAPAPDAGAPAPAPAAEEAPAAA